MGNGLENGFRQLKQLIMNGKFIPAEGEQRQSGSVATIRGKSVFVRMPV